MPRQFKVAAILTFALSILFFVFFDQSKHVPALANVNVFNVDPYDAVGSFGVMLAMFASLLALMRTFRPYANNETIAAQKDLIARAEIVTVLSVAVTMTANVIALIRFSSVWIGSSAGQMLAALVVGMILVTAFAGWLIFRTADLQPERGSWRNAWIVCIASIIILAVYPSAWDQVIVGGIGTALVGMVILFVTVWALAAVIFPQVNFHYEDSMDDLIAIYRWLKARSGFAVSGLNRFEKAAARPKVRALSGWLNPRRHNWNFSILIAVGIGIAVASAEAIGEGVSPDFGRFVLVMSVFIGIGGAGVLVGYGLLGKFLGLYRDEHNV